MEEQFDKATLLSTQMNKLDLGRIFDRYFFTEETIGTSSVMHQRDVLTLERFMKLNAELKAKNEPFVTYEPGKKFYLDKGLNKNHTSWHKLRNLLKRNGFDYHDWVQLLPEVKTSRGMQPDYSLLNK